MVNIYNSLWKFVLFLWKLSISEYHKLHHMLQQTIQANDMDSDQETEPLLK